MREQLKLIEPKRDDQVRWSSILRGKSRISECESGRRGETGRFWGSEYFIIFFSFFLGDCSEKRMKSRRVEVETRMDLSMNDAWQSFLLILPAPHCTSAFLSFVHALLFPLLGRDPNRYFQAQDLAHGPCYYGFGLDPQR